MNLDDVRNLTPFDRLLYWCKERESIRRKRSLGLPPPWTGDDILSSYRFTNVRRMDDAVSEWLLKHWYRPYRDHPNAVAAAVLARLVNVPASLTLVTPFVFDEEPGWGAAATVLRGLKAGGATVFSAAYMVRCDAGIDKVQYVCDVCRSVSSLPDGGNELVHPVSMEETWRALCGIRGLGSFLAGQVAADLRWAMSGAWRDKGTWAPPGPGSLRGMNRLHGRPPNSPAAVRNWDQEFPDYLHLVKAHLPSDLTKRLEAIDLQNVLCETDKYTRVLLGEGRPKQLYRPKAGEPTC